jgi:hypothetical protein
LIINTGQSVIVLIFHFSYRISKNFNNFVNYSIFSLYNYQKYRYETVVFSLLIVVFLDGLSQNYTPIGYLDYVDNNGGYDGPYDADAGTIL